LVRNQEIIPVDAILINGEGNIDNSFITGESESISKQPGDKIFAGGKQIGSSWNLKSLKMLTKVTLPSFGIKKPSKNMKPDLIH
jgi:Cu+-exporting ATPase